MLDEETHPDKILVQFKAADERLQKAHLLMDEVMVNNKSFFEQFLVVRFITSLRLLQYGTE